MTMRQSMMRLLPVLREYGALERKRVREGVTPLEYKRWCELEQALSTQTVAQAIPDGGPQRRHLRVPTRMLVEYRSHDELEAAIVSNVSKGGLFITTDFPPEIGTTFVLILRVDETGEHVEVPCEVASVAREGEPGEPRRGMGVKFIGLGHEQQRAVDALFAAALGHERLEELIGD